MTIRRLTANDARSFQALRLAALLDAPESFASSHEEEKNLRPAGGERLHVLFLCSRNQWRSPTAEQVWRRHPRVEARSAGLSSAARRVVSEADLAWADVVLVMEDKHRSRLLGEHRDVLGDKPVHVLDIPDDYRYMDPELVELLGDPVADLLRLAR
jgi:predicted protein tyrosine phosphatase